MRSLLPSRVLTPRGLRAAGLAALLAISTVGIAPSTRAAGVSHAVKHVGHLFARNIASATGSVTLPPPSVCAAAFNSLCYGPSQIRSAYNIPSNLTGAGQTIVIMEEIGYPNIRQDVHVFDQAFGLPDPKINILYPNGYTPDAAGGVGVTLGVAAEEALDVEWSHAIAPAATIDIVVESSDYALGYDGPGTPALAKMYNAEQFAVSRHLGNQMSISYGFSDLNFAAGATDPNVISVGNTFAQAVANKMSVFISTGDQGANNITRTPDPTVASAAFQSEIPNVTGVSGTRVFLNDNGTRQSVLGGAEQVWNDDDNIPTIGGGACTTAPSGEGGATGGSPSAIFSTSPSYQTGNPLWQALGATARTESDVSFNADYCTGVFIFVSGPYNPFGSSGFLLIGGTSYSAPAWAGITALINQSRSLASKGPIGFLNPPLYALAANPVKYANDFFDITTGDNNEPVTFGGPATVGFPALTGYDEPTGLGSPNVGNLITDLTALP